MKQLVRTVPFFLALFASTICACAPTRPPKGLDNPDLIVSGALAQVNPRDVVVLPIQNNTGRENLPLEDIRQNVMNGLVRLKYSPLSLEFVDTQAVEAAYKPGQLEEQAILQLVINNWDDSQWRSMSRLRVQAEIYLLDSRSPDPRQALWGGKVDRRIELTRESDSIANAQAFTRLAVQRFTDDVLASLPARNPEKVIP